MGTIANMTLEDLKRLIDEVVERRLKELLGEFEIDEDTFIDEPEDSRSLQEIFQSIDQNMWTPPTDAKSSLELLREDREG